MVCKWHGWSTVPDSSAAGGDDNREADPEPTPSTEVRTYTAADTVHRGDTLAGLLLRNRMGLQEIERVLREIRTRDYFSPCPVARSGDRIRSR